MTTTPPSSPSNAEQVLIVGAGHAGTALAMALRQAGYAGAVTLLDRESHLPYQKPPLSKAYLAGLQADETLRFRPAEFFVQQRIARQTGEVTAIDRGARQLVLADGTRLGYSHLALAPGARHRRLGCTGEALRGVQSVRNLDEARGLREALTRCQRAVIVGAGFVGLEVARTARSAGLSVQVLERAERILMRALSATSAQVLEAAHRAAGVELQLGVGVTELTGQDGQVTGVRSTDGQWRPADLVLVAVGAVPDTTLAEQAGLAVSNQGGILVDEQLRTSDPNITALGDAAAFPWPGQASPMRLESVQNALEQARCVAARLTGQARPYLMLPTFWSDQGTVKLQITGLAMPDDDAVWLPGANAVSGTTLLFRHGRLQAAESLSRPTDQLTVRKLLTQHLHLSADEAAKPGFSLVDWSKAHSSEPQPNP